MSGDAPAVRVLLVGPSLRIVGGQAVMADELVRRMRADGLDVDFLPINPKPPGPLALAERVKGLRTLVVSCCYVASLLRHVRHYDVIHLFSASYLSFLIAQMPAILIAGLFRTPVLLNYRSGEAEDHLAHASGFVHGLIRRCAGIVVPSGFLVEVFGRHGFPAVAIPNVVDPARILYRHRTSVVPRIVVPRTLEELYNVACAVRAFAIVKRSVPAATLTILGEGSEESSLRALVAELELTDVTFAGRVGRDEIQGVYEAHDLLLNTSSIDNMPVSILEGFAAGLPVVTTDAGGIPFLVEDRVNGHLVPVNDHEAVASRILELVENPDEVDRLSRACANEAAKYVWDVVAADWYRLYSETAGTDQGGARAALVGEPR